MEEGLIESTGKALGEIRKQTVLHLGVEVSLWSRIDLNQEDTNHEGMLIVRGATQLPLTRSLHGAEHHQKRPKTEGSSLAAKATGEDLIGRQIPPPHGEVIHQHLELERKVDKIPGHSHVRMTIMEDILRNERTREGTTKVLFASTV